MPVSDLGFNVLGTVAAIISLGALVPSFIFWFLARMPTAKLHRLEALLAETEAMFGKAAEQGVFTREAVLNEFNLSLWAYVTIPFGVGFDHSDHSTLGLISA